MLKIPSVELKRLIESIIAKHQWTQSRLAKELNLGPETITRWKSGAGIHKGHYDELLKLNKDLEILAPEPSDAKLIPFYLTIPRNTMKITLDKNGDISIQGHLVAMLVNKNKEN